jgi:hypothetical protein
LDHPEGFEVVNQAAGALDADTLAELGGDGLERLRRERESPVMAQALAGGVEVREN